jgi:hypothetical protein
MPVWAKVVLGAFLWLVGMNKWFDQKHYKGDGRLFTCTGSSATESASCLLSYLEFDDEGKEWNTGADKALLEKLTPIVLSGHTTIVVYVHGWHDNASRNNSQRIAFVEKLDELTEAINAPAFLNARSALASARPEERVVGIYVGWRGQVQWPKPVDYVATFWSRKAAAQRIGRGDLADFLLRLHVLCHPAKLRPTGVTNLIVVGHSFGAAALLATISRPLWRRQIGLAVWAVTAL